MKRLATLALSVAFLFPALADAPASAPLETPAAQLALKLDALLDKIEEPKIEVTNALLVAWTLEALPYFEYEGVTGMAIRPDNVQFVHYPTAMENFHVLGRAYCNPAGGGPVEINARAANPASPWHGRPFILATLVHELIHVQGGGFCDGSSAELESTTQLVTLEVLAAMANHGNALALYTVLDELRDMALAAAHYEAMASGDNDRYRALERKVYSTPQEQARLAKSARRWELDQATLKEILYKYSKIPIDKIIRGLERKAIPNLKLGPPAVYGFNSTPQESERRWLVIDDLAYVLDHAAEMLAGGGGLMWPPFEPQGEGSRAVA